jgi:hypothetical protein
MMRARPTKRPPSAAQISYYGADVEKDADGEVVKSGIKLYGDTVHIFIERKNYNGTFLPGYKALEECLQPAQPPASNTWTTWWRTWTGTK